MAAARYDLRRRNFMRPKLKDLPPLSKSLSPRASEGRSCNCPLSSEAGEGPAKPEVGSLWRRRAPPSPKGPHPALRATLSTLWRRDSCKSVPLLPSCLRTDIHGAWQMQALPIRGARASASLKPLPRSPDDGDGRGARRLCGGHVPRGRAFARRPGLPGVLTWKMWFQTAAKGFQHFEHGG